MPFHHTAGFWSRLQRQGCTKPLIKVEAAGRSSRVRRLPGTGPGALETHAFPTPALQKQQLTLRKAGSFVRRSASGQPRGMVTRLRSSLSAPSRTGGQSKPLRSGTLAHGYVPGSTPPTLGFSQHPSLRSSQVCLRSAGSSPARSAGPRQGSDMVVSFGPARRPDAGGSHGTSRPSRRYRSITAACSCWRVTATHRSSTLPPAPQRKHCHTPLPRWAAKDRLRGPWD
jgi:hypothetical protein